MRELRSSRNRLRGAVSLSLLFVLALLSLRAGNFPDPSTDETAPASKHEQAVLAGGCFWGTEDVFAHLKGVQKVVSGYSGGEKKTAHSDLVEAGQTGHAESVMITYDPSQITYGQILKVFFFVAHDPTQINRQGPDTGAQYRSVIFYATDEQKTIAESYIRQIETSGILQGKIATQVSPLKGFFPAEPFLQHYSQQHPTDPYILQNDAPRLQALKQNFPALFTPEHGQH